MPINIFSDDKEVPKSKSAIKRNVRDQVDSNIKGKYAGFPQPVGSLPNISRDDNP